MIYSDRIPPCQPRLALKAGCWLAPVGRSGQPWLSSAGGPGLALLGLLQPRLQLGRLSFRCSCYRRPRHCLLEAVGSGWLVWILYTAPRLSLPKLVAVSVDWQLPSSCAQSGGGQCWRVQLWAGQFGALSYCGSARVGIWSVCTTFHQASESVCFFIL